MDHQTIGPTDRGWHPDLPPFFIFYLFGHRIVIVPLRLDSSKCPVNNLFDVWGSEASLCLWCSYFQSIHHFTPELDKLPVLHFTNLLVTTATTNFTSGSIWKGIFPLRIFRFIRCNLGLSPWVFFPSSIFTVMYLVPPPSPLVHPVPAYLISPRLPV